MAPNVSPTSGLPHHEWLIEFSKSPEDIDAFENALDSELINLNTYYKDLLTGNILRKLKIRILRKDTFRDYMKSIGKLGGQNKVPRLSNDRIIAENLIKLQSF